MRAGDDRVADVQRAALDQHRDDRAAARVELGLDDDARRLGVRVGLELLELGDDEDRLEQVVEARPGSWPRRRRTRSRRPTPTGCRPRSVISVRTRVGSAPSLSILLTATTIGTSAALAWSIASSVCGLTPSSAATTMTAMSVTFAPRARIAVNASWPGRVEERDRACSFVVDLVGADVLRDAAGLARDDLGLADRVEQRRLAVVDVAHDRDDRRALDEVLVGVLEDGLGVDLVGRRGRSRPPCSNSSARTWIASSESVCVSVAISPSVISFLMISGTGHAEVLGDVLDRRAGVDRDEVGHASCAAGVERQRRRRRL